MKTHFRRKDRRRRTSKRSKSRRFRNRKKYPNLHKFKFKDLKIAIQNIYEKESRENDSTSTIIGRKMHEQKMHEQKIHEQKMHEQKMHEQKMHEQKMHKQKMHIFAQIDMNIEIKSKRLKLKYDNQRSIVVRVRDLTPTID